MFKDVDLGLDPDAIIEILPDGRHTLFNSAGSKYIVHGPKSCRGQRCAIHHPTQHRMIHWAWIMGQSDGTHRGVMIYRICQHQKLHPDPDALDFVMQGEPIPRMGFMVAHYLDMNCCGCCIGKDDDHGLV